MSKPIHPQRIFQAYEASADRSLRAVEKYTSEAPHLEWARDRICEYLHVSDIVIASVVRMRSRNAPVYRLLTRSQNRTVVFFLKCYLPTSPSSLNARFEYLRAIAKSCDAAPLLTPYTVVGSDIHLRLLLTAEVPGESLLVIHKRMTRTFGIWSRETAIRGWHGLGVWLRLLHWHTVAPQMSSTRVQELRDYICVRFTVWESADPRKACLARRAREVVQLLAREASRTPVLVTLSHGDVSTGNVLVGARTGVVDPDDIGFDMPALDLSHALLEVREFGYLGSIIPSGRLGLLARDAFLAGYEHPLPAGVEFWLPHLRNLSVQLVTLASRRLRPGISRAIQEPHYRRTIRELVRSLDAISASQDVAAHVTLRRPKEPSDGHRLCARTGL